jgi:hypothetical protein
MCAIVLAALALMALLGALGQWWWVVPAAGVTYVVWRGWYEYHERTRAAAELKATRAHLATIVDHREQLTYWRGQLAEVDTPSARQVAEDLVGYNEGRLRELRGRTGAITPRRRELTPAQRDARFSTALGLGTVVLLGAVLVSAFAFGGDEPSISE